MLSVLTKVCCCIRGQAIQFEWESVILYLLFLHEIYIVSFVLGQAVSLDEDARVLEGQEVRMVHRVVFRLDLPNRKTLTVKAKHGKSLAQVLRPILSKYGYRLEMVTLCLVSIAFEYHLNQC